ncbi:MAG: D-alanine-D-alanine ligase [Bacteriovoracaceae bacterium]|jgi:D-alanine-D-alanine ligase
MAKKEVLLICGGGSTEHEVSLVSAEFIFEQLKDWDEINLHYVVIEKDGNRRDREGALCELRKSGDLVYPDKSISLDFVIPCIHGYPGETGDIQSVFEMMSLPYLGCNPETSIICFNKVTTKLWFDNLGIPNTPFCYLTSLEEDQLEKADEFFSQHNDVYIKASNQGSSVGCYHCNDKKGFHSLLKEAFNYSDYVLIEKTIRGRELEMSAYEFNGEVQISDPGEIICPNEFYTYEEKYNSQSSTTTIPKAKEVSEEVVKNMKKYALLAFKALKLKHLSRIDFFLTDEGEVYLNEINTFPGMTPISLFPLMMEQNGHSYKEWIRTIISNESRK